MTSPSLEDLENEPLNAERMRRMKSLMRQLYKEEFEAQKLRLPEIKGGALMMVASFVAIVLFASLMLYNYNMFVSLRERVWSAQGHVEAAVQRRSNLFANLVNLTLNHAELEREVYRHVVDVRQEMKKSGLIRPPADGATLQSGDQGAGSNDLAGSLADFSSANLSRLLAVVEQYPDIKSSTTYKDLMASLLEIEDRIVKYRMEANEETKIFNTLISSFPWYILARMTGFKIEPYYSVDFVNDKIPVLTTDSFKRLLPYGEPGRSSQEQPVPTEPAKDK